MSQEKIIEKMQEFAKILEYEHKDIQWLAKAMNAEKVAKDDHANDSLATLGDTILKFVLTEFFYDKGNSKGQITEKKKMFESNDSLYELSEKLGLPNYAYKKNGFSNELPQNDRVANSQHNQYIEAIIGAIYKDRGMRYAKKWVLKIFSKYKKLDEKTD